MTAKEIAFLAIFLVLAMPLGAASESEIPYIEITNPPQGETIPPKPITIEFRAEAFESLDYPELVIETYSGDGTGTGIVVKPLCAVGGGPGHTAAYCSYEWDATPFPEHKANFIAVITADGQKISDEVGVFVSGECA